MIENVYFSTDLLLIIASSFRTLQIIVLFVFTPDLKLFRN